MGGMGGFFSIPAERTLRLPYTSVCLQHGKDEPNRRMKYKLVPTEEFTKDPVLQQLVNLVGTGKLDQGSAQAAAWHVSNKMSWQELNMKVYQEFGKQDAPYFNPMQLQAAQNIVSMSMQRAAEETERKAAAAELPVQPDPVPASNPRESVR